MTCLCHCFRMLRTALQAKPGEPLVPYVSRVTKNDTRSGAILGQYHFVSKARVVRIGSFVLFLYKAPSPVPVSSRRVGEGWLRGPRRRAVQSPVGSASSGRSLKIALPLGLAAPRERQTRDRKSTRLNSSHT